jgi:hypothetical protein
MKQAVVTALESNEFETVHRLTLMSRKVLSVLVRLAYDKETLVGWRAIIATGEAASVLVRNNYDFLRETVRKLLWSLTDESGGIGWSAPELLGEIVSADPKRFCDIVPLIAEVFSIEEAVFRPGVLYAFKRIAESHPEMINPYQEIIQRGLSEEDPMARIRALELILSLKERLGAGNFNAVASRIHGLMQDRAEVWLYRNGGFTSIEVRELAREVHSRLKNNF